MGEGQEQRKGEGADEERNKRSQLEPLWERDSILLPLQILLPITLFFLPFTYQ